MKQFYFLLLCTTTFSYGSAAKKDGEPNSKQAAEVEEITVIDLFRTTSEYGDGMGQGELIMMLVSTRNNPSVIYHPATPATTPNQLQFPYLAAITTAAAVNTNAAAIPSPVQLHRQRSNSLPGKSVSFFSSSPSHTYRAIGSRRNSLPNQELHEKMAGEDELKNYLAQKKFEHDLRTNCPAS
jgi:hypothetical protein